MADQKQHKDAARSHEEHLREKHLMLDPLPRGKMNEMVMEAMMAPPTWKWWLVFTFLAGFVVWGLFYNWSVLITKGQGEAGVMRPDYWGIFLVNTVFWIGISHAGTFISAILRVFRSEFRRPFTRAAELMTTFGLVQAGFSVFMHMGRVWLAYWLMPYPNQRMLWPNLHSPLTWDLLAITTYVLGSTMYLFLPLIPDMAMARDRSTGWRKTFYKILALGFRGTEGEWTHLRNAMNIFAFAIIPVMFSVHTIVSWDFAAATRPGWNSTIFGPYFVIGALHSGMGAAIAVLAVIRGTMKNMKYFIRPEHFDAVGKLMLIISMGWTYFFFNDYMVQWYGGDKWTRQLLHFHEAGPLGWLWFVMLISNIAIPWAILWNQKWRSTPWLVATVGIIINVGMWIERYVIIPISVTINRMPFTWRMYTPGIEIPMGLGTVALFILLYMIASKLIPLIPVWEVQEGQMAHAFKKFGRETVVTVSELE
ncbi:MAG: polysulfide reductase NrfD [Anaerolineales bacterium]|nr:polysulfide reductase NrfD [Anaerolineales bacterium]GJQ36345.1 MAG: Fe-S-cluster-containing hydrogenase [Anaerolineaceae bacterium]